MGALTALPFCTYSSQNLQHEVHFYYFLRFVASTKCKTALVETKQQTVPDKSLKLVVVVVLPDPFLGMGARINSAESQ